MQFEQTQQNYLPALAVEERFLFELRYVTGNNKQVKSTCFATRSG